MLKLENRIDHNINDLQFAKWIVDNFTEDEFQDDRYRGNSGFGCKCDDDKRELKDENSYRLRLGYVEEPTTQRDRDLNLWLERLLDFDPEYDESEIHVYYCSKCEQWAIDERV